MKLRITPLNIVTALAIMVVALLLIDKKQILSVKNSEFTSIWIALCLLVVFVSFLSDQIFRKFIPNLLKIWIVELALLALTTALIIILKISFIN